MKPQKQFMRLSVLVIASLILAACAPAATQAPQPTAVPGVTQSAASERAKPTVAAAEKITIRLTSWAGAEESAQLQKVLDEINAQATAFQIVHEPVPDDYYTKLQTSLAGGTGADLMWLSQEWIAGFASQGGLLDITDYVKNDDVTAHPAADLSDYFPGVLQTAQYDGRLYGLPWIAQPVVLYYNKDLFDQAGVKYPDDTWTWDTFEKAAVALTKDTDGDSKNDQWGFTMNGWPPPQMFVWQAGGSVIAADLQSSPVDSPEALKGLEFYASLIYNDKHTPPESVIKEQGFGEMFKAGKVAMFMGGASDDLDRVEGLKVGVAQVPMGASGKHVTFAWTASTVVNAQTKNPDLAYEALVALTEGIHHWKIVAPRISLATAEEIAKSDPLKAGTAADIAKSVPFMQSFTNVPRQQEWDTIFWNQFMDPLFHGKGTAEDLAKEIRPKLEELLP